MFEQALAGVHKSDLGWGFLGAEHAGKDFALGGQRVEHPLLDGALGDEVDNVDSVALAMAVGAGDALFQHGRIPGQVEVDHQAGGLQVESHSAGVGREKDTDVVVFKESFDKRPSLAGGYIAG